MNVNMYIKFTEYTYHRFSILVQSYDKPHRWLND